MNKQQAQIIVETELKESQDTYNPVDCVVIETQTIEKSWGWVFFYQSKQYIESQDFRDMLGGNAPIIVNKITGDLTYTGTAQDINHYINEYETKLAKNT